MAPRVPELRPGRAEHRTLDRGVQSRPSASRTDEPRTTFAPGSPKPLYFKHGPMCLVLRGALHDAHSSGGLCRFATKCYQRGWEPYRDVYERNGRHVGTRTPDLYRVNFEVIDLKPFPHLAFPHFSALENTPKQPSFDGELMAGSRWSYALI